MEQAVTALQLVLSCWVNQIRFEDKRFARKCQSLSDPRVKTLGIHTEHQDGKVPRNLIEEFDSGSA